MLALGMALGGFILLAALDKKLPEADSEKWLFRVGVILVVVMVWAMIS